MKRIASVALCVLLLVATDTRSAAAQADGTLAAYPEDTRIEVMPGPHALAPAADESALAQRLQTSPELLVAAASPLRASLDAAPAPGSVAPALALQRSRRSGLTFLVVGVSLIAAGLLIDGDAGAVVSVGGALVGAYGVYLLVRD